MFQKLIKHPTYIFKFAIYFLFVFLAIMLYFSNLFTVKDTNLKLTYCLVLLLYGVYRIVRAYQDFKQEIKNEEN